MSAIKHNSETTETKSIREKNYTFKVISLRVSRTTSARSIFSQLKQDKFRISAAPLEHLSYVSINLHRLQGNIFASGCGPTSL